MTESAKTAIFAAVAAVFVLLAVLTQPRVARTTAEEGSLPVGSLMFTESFSDASKAAAVKITEFDEDKLAMKAFEVARDKDSGLWKLPSVFDYPADATEQVQKATTPLTDLKILDVVSTNRADQPLYGVVEPNEKLEAGVTGVGMLISVADDKGKTLAGLIVGKEDPDRSGLRFVRIPNQDPIYRVEIDPAVFATDFKKWIKADLLDVKSFDITGIGFRDYEIERTQNGNSLGGRMTYTMDADVSYDTATSKWKLDKLVSYDKGAPEQAQLAEGEELKSDKLNEVRTAAQGLQIVGVLPKPKGLAADLKAEKALLDSNEAMLSLFQKGFIPQEANGATEIYASSGETLLKTQNGVQYTLRFGEQRLGEDSETPKAEGDKPAAESTTRERYLLVTAKLDESQFPQPDLQPVPETIEDLKKLDAEKAAAAASKAGTGVAPSETPTEKASEPASEPQGKPAPEADSPKSEPAATEAKPQASPAEKSTATPAEQPKASDEPKASDAPKDENECGPQPPSDTPATEEKPKQEPKADSASQAPDAAAAAAKPAQVTDAKVTDAQAKPPETEEELKDRLAVVREEITKANQRLIEARNEKLDAARKRVGELNAKFADWYYLINESSYSQLKLKKAAFIGPKGPATGAAPTGAMPQFNFPGGIPNLPPAGVP